MDGGRAALAASALALSVDFEALMADPQAKTGGDGGVLLVEGGVLELKDLMAVLAD